MLHIEYHSRRSTYYELHVRSIASQLENCYDLYTFERVFNEDLKKVPRKSVGTADCFYTTVMDKEGKELKVHHLNAKGDIDRCVLTVTKKNNA